MVAAVSPVALTIAGSDPSGGAGIQADLKTFHQYGVYGTSVLTLVTVQDTRGVRRVEPLSAELVAEQLAAITADLPPAAVKTGALGSAAVVEAVAAAATAAGWPLVVDPVMAATSGPSLLDADGVKVLAEQLLPLAHLVTPNQFEAEVLAGRKVEGTADMAEAARAIADLGPEAVLVKGGDISGPPVDVLWAEGAIHRFEGCRVPDGPHHGTGCTLSAAITAELARGTGLVEAVAAARGFVTRALAAGPILGGGMRLLDHHAEI